MEFLEAGLLISSVFYMLSTELEKERKMLISRAMLNQQSNGSNNINDLASTNTHLSTKPEFFDKKPESLRGIGSFISSELQFV